MHQRLTQQGLVTREQLASTRFQHAIFRPTAARPANSHPSASLHIYIEGDGAPFRRRNLIASDPTSPSSSMLQAMLQDESPRLLLGRPCYYQVKDPQCNGRWWTSHRYSEQVVNSMVEIVDRLAAEGGGELWLIGHSGGGALAVLIGARLQRPVTVVTVAANLDTDAWTAHQGYSPLAGSLNPISETLRNPQLRELHWYGSDDSNVLPAWSLHYCAQHQASCAPYEGGHTGWLSQWPRLLAASREHFKT